MDIKATTIIVFSGVLFACSPNDCNFTIASDQFRHADTVEHLDSQYYLYTRTTGWNDKAVYFELYDQSPQFDHCGAPNIEPIYFVVFDDYPEKQYVKNLILQPDQPEKLKITYTTDINTGVTNVYDVKFSQ